MKLPKGVNTMPDGRFRRRVTRTYADGTRKRLQVYAWTLDDLYLKTADALSGEPPSPRVSGTPETVGEYLDRWLELIKPDAPLPGEAYREPERPKVRWNTYCQRRNTIRTHIEPALIGHKPFWSITLDQVTGDDVDALLAYLRDKRVGGRARQVAFEVLRAAFRHAAKKRWMKPGCLDTVDRPTHKSRRVGIADETQIVKLLAEIDRLPRWKALFTTAIHTTMRLGEVLGLTWDRVDLDTGYAYVHAQLTDTETGVALTPPKTDEGRRDIALTPDVLQALRDERKRQMSRGVQTEYVFPSETGAALDRSNFRSQVFKPLMERAGCAGLTFHGFRHLAATLRAEAGVPLHVTMHDMGHKSSKVTTEIYTHTTDRAKRDSAKRVQARLDELKHEVVPGVG